MYGKASYNDQTLNGQRICACRGISDEGDCGSLKTVITDKIIDLMQQRAGANQNFGYIKIVKYNKIKWVSHLLDSSSTQVNPAEISLTLACPV